MNWISVNDAMPEVNTPVYVADKDFLNTMLAEYASTPDGCLWARIYDSVSGYKGKWDCSESEIDDDYGADIAFWHPLPVIPYKEKK